MITRGKATVKRVCDVCGVYRDAKPGVFRVVSGRMVCSYHDTYVPREEAEKRSRIHVITAKPIKNARPLAPRDTHFAAEAELLNFLALTAPYETREVTVNPAAASGASAAAAGWASVYFYDLITEAKRPVEWTDYSRVRLKALANWLRENQYAGPSSTVSALTATDPRWGGYLNASGNMTAEDSAAAGLGLLRAYQVFGDARYLASARACAWFLRACQAGSLATSGYTTSDTGWTSRVYHGTWARHYSTGFGLFEHIYDLESLLCLEFLVAFRAVAGDETIGGPSVTGFTSTIERSASNCIADAVAFWTSGVYSAADVAVVSALSTSTPRHSFWANQQGLVAEGSWRFHGNVTLGAAQAAGLAYVGGRGIAHAIRALRAYEGETARVLALFDWLMSFTSNSSYELPATTANRLVSGYDDRYLYAGLRGTFQPQVALATEMLVYSGVGSAFALTKTNGSSLYDLATAGLLAPLYSTRHGATFKLMKDALNTPRPRSKAGTSRDRDAHLFLSPLGACGLSLQPYTTAGLSRVQSVTAAAMTGLVYRQAPSAHLGRGN